ncbi:hypothetical protein OFN63_35125, partial [Escherichia coli]|nr:hypothetical protein [Escherichia coli]
RYWYQGSNLDLPWFFRLFIGSITGLAISSMLAGSMAFIVPLTITAMSLISPLLFALIHPIIQALTDKKWFQPTNHPTLDNPWYLRL